MINNFDLIRSYLKFENSGDFYFIQLISRRKDNPELDKAQYVRKTYYIYSLEGFDKKREEIIHFCEYYNARAYIHFTKRNNETISKHMVQDIVRDYFNGVRDFSHLWETVCGQHCEKPKTWVIDIDKKDNESIEDQILLATNRINSCMPFGNKIVATIPTKNGVHLITEPFNLLDFKNGYKFETVPDVHKNNPTVLYIP